MDLEKYFKNISPQEIKTLRQEDLDKLKDLARVFLQAIIEEERKREKRLR